MIKYNPSELSSNNEKKKFELLPEGDYEIVIDNASFKINPNGGKKYIGFTCTVRADVDQDFKNRKIFDNSYPLTATGEWNDKRLFSMLGACKVPARDYKDYDELLEDLEGQYAQAHVVKHEWNGKVNNQISYYHSTKNPAQTIDSVATKDSQSFNVNVIDDDEFPF